MKARSDQEEEEQQRQQAGALRKYLLGSLSDKEEMRRIEEKLMLADDDFFSEQLSIAEDELMDEYLDGSLSESDRDRFIHFFLISPERKEKLRLVRNLRKYALSQTNAPSPSSANPAAEKKVGLIDLLRGLFSSPALRFAALALIICGLGFAVWRAAFYQSDVDKGLAELRIAYRGQRPLESRTTVDFEYAEVSDTRSADKIEVTDARAYRRAKDFLLKATEEAAQAEAYHAQGLLYLAEKKFDEALEEFNHALKLAPDNARLHSDLGALYLEKANLVRADENQAEVSRNIDSSLRHLNRALELNENLSEALFNKALVLQKTPAPEQAREAWRKYLEKDSTSGWAKEAQRKLQELESQKSQNLSADELEKAFLEAFRQKNEAEAVRLISQNRELITGKYIPQKLAASFVKAPTPDTESEYLQALIYAGELEKKNIGDSSVETLANFYSKISIADLESVRQAQVLLQNSYELCSKAKLNEALEKAERARQIFLQAGDAYQGALSRFVIVYCLIKINGRIRDSIAVALDLADECRRNNYKWLLSHTLYWLAAAQRVSGDRTSAKDNYKDCLALAKEIRDPQILQKILISFANQNKFVGQNQASLDYLQQAFNAIAEGRDLSEREKWRSYSDSIEALSAAGLYSLAEAVSMENYQVAKASQDSSFIAYSQLDNGIVNAQTEDFEEARTWLYQVKQNAETNHENDERDELLVKSLLTLGYLERKLDNFSQAAKFYDEAFGIVENSERRFFLYEVEKARLLTNISMLDKGADHEEQITRIINLAEGYRKEISAERDSKSFFNNQQDIYDIAVANAYKHGRREQAYNYLESSNARSLLDWLKKGVSVKFEKEKIENIEITFKENTQPLSLDEIRAQMPERVQILQYAVLENKVLVWLVSKDNFAVAASEIESKELNEKIAEYTDLVSVRDDKKQEASKRLARELYDLLIAPIASQLNPQRDTCVIPHKILFHLPFAALTAADGKPFLAQFNFFYAPSANVFLLFTENARRKSADSSESLLSVGNPHFNRNEFKNLRDLPKAEDEAREIIQFYPSYKPLLAQAATKTALQDSMNDAEVIHFAGHYLVRHGEPLSSGLLLTPDKKDSRNSDDGILTNAELINQKLPRARLVVLSACQTGVEQYYNGEGLVGLSRTFLAAGAPLVVASQWQVDSAATAELMKKFHFFRRRENLTTTMALRRAQLEMLEAPDENLRQPYFWAAFAAYGGYAEF